MMMDTQWGVGVASAPAMTGFGTIGFADNAINGMTDDDIEGMIDGLVFFSESNDDIALVAQSQTIAPVTISSEITKPIESPSPTRMAVEAPTTTPNYAMVSPTHLPIFTNDTGAVVSIPDIAISTTTSDTTESIIYPAIIPSNSKSNSIALPQPPQLMTTTPPVTTGSKIDIDSVLEEQRKTILNNQKIIDAQMTELEGSRKQQPLRQPPIPVISMPAPETALSTTTSNAKAKASASYTLAHAALKKADELDLSKPATSTRRGTKRKANSCPISAAQANAYQKWKLTPAGATKLRAADLKGLKNQRSSSSNSVPGKAAPQEDANAKVMTPDELEVRRERNRKHAKKSRMRKKSLTTELEQSLEVLRDENTKLRKRLADHIAAKKAAEAKAEAGGDEDPEQEEEKDDDDDDSSSSASAADQKAVDALLEDYRVRSHVKFIAGILADRSKRKTKKKTSKKTTTSNEDQPAGKGIVVDEKTLKVLRGLTKSVNQQQQ